MVGQDLAQPETDMASTFGRMMALASGGGTVFLASALLLGTLPEPATGVMPVDQLLGFLASAREVLGAFMSTVLVVLFGTAFTALCLAPASSRTADGGSGSGSWFDGGGDGCGDGGD